MRFRGFCVLLSCRVSEFKIFEITLISFAHKLTVITLVLCDLILIGLCQVIFISP
jgi:hypothetical protein